MEVEHRRASRGSPILCYLRTALHLSGFAVPRPGPCWYLNGIGVDPSAQRTGLGSALINQMLPRIDDDALPAFLDTSAPDNLGYYERFGFLVTAELTLPNGIPLWGMTRQPSLGLAQECFDRSNSRPLLGLKPGHSGA